MRGDDFPGQLRNLQAQAFKLRLQGVGGRAGRLAVGQMSGDGVIVFNALLRGLVLDDRQPQGRPLRVNLHSPPLGVLGGLLSGLDGGGDFLQLRFCRRDLRRDGGHGPVGMLLGLQLRQVPRRITQGLMRCQGLFIGFRQHFIPGAVLCFHGFQGAGQLRDSGLSRHSGHQELASSGLRHRATAVGQLPGLGLSRRKAGLKLPDADPAVCQVFVLCLPCGQQRLGGFKGLGKPLLGFCFCRGQGVKRGLSRLHVRLSVDDVLVLPELSPGRLCVQLCLVDFTLEAGQLL